MDEFYEDLLGDAAAEGDRRVRTAAADKERPPKDGLAVELDDVALVKAQGHEAAADALAAGEIDDPQGRVMGRIDEVHGSPSFKFIHSGRRIKGRQSPRPIFPTKIIGIKAASVNPRLPAVVSGGERVKSLRFDRVCGFTHNNGVFPGRSRGQ
jgi:hypothetical protein